jgi:hypothetical protein
VILRIKNLRTIYCNKTPNKGRALATVCVRAYVSDCFELEGISDPIKETGNLQAMLHISSYSIYC